MAVREQTPYFLVPQTALQNGGGIPAAPVGGSSAQPRPPWVWVLLIFVGVLIAVGVGAGAFLIGQGTRMSDDQVARRVADHVAQRAASDRRSFDLRLASALDNQRAELTHVMKRRVKRARDSAYTNGQQAGYASGHSVGYSSGNAAGQAQGEKTGEIKGREKGREQGQLEGYLQGFDDGSCYDPDTYEYIC